MERLLLATVGTILIATTATPNVMANQTAVNSNVTQNISVRGCKPSANSKSPLKWTDYSNLFDLPCFFLQS